MERSHLPTPEAYLSDLEEPQKTPVSTIYRAVQEVIDPGFECVINWGHITWQVPFSVFSDTYNGKPLMYLAVAAQKNHIGFYVTSLYQRSDGPAWILDAFAEAGKKLDMGKSCIRFKMTTDIPLEILQKEAAIHTVDSFISEYKTIRAAMKQQKGERS